MHRDLRPGSDDPASRLRFRYFAVNVVVAGRTDDAQVGHRVIGYPGVRAPLYVMTVPFVPESLPAAFTAPSRLGESLFPCDLVGRVCLPLPALLRCAYEAPTSCRA